MFGWGSHCSSLQVVENQTLKPSAGIILIRPLYNKTNRWGKYAANRIGLPIILSENILMVIS
ncbi:hypothetical protein NEILACOT_05168 [Neisseria lactamica ATCC 23970]|uniref:Uncharacterized protein n=1 Tax=Neisseria lactamica ATCC 23970 TaxID=546265 RepID=D0WC86_NEILA|nr:hypothetical protein NEILACOT_05168 [Neisseria lactamica ATCC 23970]